MTKPDPVVRKETGYIAVWVLALSAVMELVFILLGKWNLSVAGGNLAGAAMAVGNYFLLALDVSKAVGSGDPARAALKIRSSITIRLLVMAGLCAVVIGVLKADAFATLIPLLFPRIALAFRPAIDRKRGVENPASEGSDMLE